jgi:hypothetical protein
MNEKENRGGEGAAEAKWLKGGNGGRYRAAKRETTEMGSELNGVEGTIGARQKVVVDKDRAIGRSTITFQNAGSLSDAIKVIVRSHGQLPIRNSQKL